MRPFKYFFLSLFLILFTTSFSQSYKATKIVEGNSAISYPIDGSYLLEAENQFVAEYFKNHPNALLQQKLSKPQDWGFTVGTQKSFYAYNFDTSTRYSSNFTCRAVGTTCYIFVEDAVWNNSVDTTAVNAVKNAFDNSTPANPSKGIYQMDVDAFGNPPDVDNDPRIVILILDIKDGYSGSGGYVAGYFSSYNELPTSSYPQSNGGEFYYIDANPLNLKTASGLQFAMSTTAHEFQHMINFNYHQNTAPQTTFINESCSKLAELWCGYPTDNQAGYANETNYYLLGWRTNDNTLVLNDYSRAQKFGLYLWDQFGIGIYKFIVQTPAYNGVALYDYSLQQIGSGLNFTQLFENWLIANVLNDKSVNPSYGYTYPNITKSKVTNYNDPNASGSSVIQNLAAEYISFSSGSNLSITFTANSSIVVKAIKEGTGPTEVVDVANNTPFNVPDFGTTYSKITFAIINAYENGNQTYSFNSTGTANNAAQELKWDTSEPLGTLTLGLGDTVAVQFDAFQGGTLDSIRVAVRNAGQITGGIWEYNATWSPSPLGNKLASTIASISTTTPSPFPVPYQNWATVDLTSSSISTDKDFAAGFIIGKNPSVPGVMVTEFPGTDFYHSFTYSNSNARWLYWVSGNNTTYIYLIRAYVSIVTDVGTETVELLPKGFSLEQNYPNPFNPSTKITYNLADREFVSLKVYDLLGNEVATLVNEEKPAGSYNVQFSMDKLNLSSGTYFYRLQAGNFVETKKMILLK